MSEAPAREAEAPGGGGETLVPAALRHGSIAALPTARGAPETRTCVLPAAAPALPRPLSGVGVRACCHDRPPPRWGGVDPWATAA